jgi:hypothetical protein
MSPFLAGTWSILVWKSVTWAQPLFTQTYSITALGALARLPKALTEGVLSKDFDGDQIFAQFSVRFCLQFMGRSTRWLKPGQRYDPTVTWANAENNGLGEIDRPGNYELANRSSDTHRRLFAGFSVGNVGAGVYLRRRAGAHWLCRQYA